MGKFINIRVGNSRYRDGEIFRKAAAMSVLLNLNVTMKSRSSRPGILCKRLFLKILQNSQENTSAGVSFLTKLQA